MSDSSRVNTNTTGDTSPVAVPCIGYEQMSSSWSLILDLLDGTQAMRAAGTTWLPQEPSEEDDAYNARLGRSILYNGYKDTLNKLKNRPFTVPVKITDLPASLEYLEDDVDGMGTSMSDFIREILANLIKFGIAHIYVDHSKVTIDQPDSEEKRKPTIAEETAAGARVFFTSVSPVDLIGWQTQKVENSSVQDLTQIRIQETSIEADGDYGDGEVDYVTVYNKDDWERHQKLDPEKNDSYQKVEDGPSTLGKIPLVTIYASKDGYMTAEAPLMDLAWLNLAHWQSYSDQRNILKFSRFGLLFGKGFSPAQVKSGKIVVGPRRAVLTNSTEAELKYVEPSGKGIEAGQWDLGDIEEKMRVLGNQPTVKDIPTTATENRNDESRTVSQLQTWVGATERGMVAALKLAAEWRGVEPSEEMAIDIYSDFEATILGGSDKELLLKTREAGEITRERHLREQQRRGVYSQDMDPEEEARLAAAEKQADEAILMKDLMPDGDVIEDEDEDEDDDDDDPVEDPVDEDE